jgi:hypothetical protein
MVRRRCRRCAVQHGLGCATGQYSPGAGAKTLATGTATRPDGSRSSGAAASGVGPGVRGAEPLWELAQRSRRGCGRPLGTRTHCVARAAAKQSVARRAAGRAFGHRTLSSRRVPRDIAHGDSTSTIGPALAGQVQAVLARCTRVDCVRRAFGWCNALRGIQPFFKRHPDNLGSPGLASGGIQAGGRTFCSLSLLTGMEHR